MKNFICLIMALTLCVSLACPVLASDFQPSPGTEPTGCNHDGSYTVFGRRGATCYEEGYTGDHVCDECGEVIKYGEVIPTVPHNYENGVCVVCGADESVPETGDNNFVGVWMFVMAVAAVGLVAVTSVYRKKYANQ